MKFPYLYFFWQVIRDSSDMSGCIAYAMPSTATTTYQLDLCYPLCQPGFVCVWEPIWGGLPYLDCKSFAGVVKSGVGKVEGAKLNEPFV